LIDSKNELTNIL